MQPTQLRLAFAAPQAPLTLALSLVGLHVHVTSANPQLAWTYLSEAGANPTMNDGRGLSFPAAHLARVADLPEQVTLTADRSLRTLLTLACNPPVDGQPAELSCEVDKSLWLRWFDGDVEHHEPVPSSAAGVLLTADLPFVATPAAFDVLRTAAQLPVLLGRAQVNSDGYVEIVTAKPQLVELAPLPGLFRIDETRFGLALPHASALATVPGFTWASGPPALDRGPGVLPPLPMPLSTHAAADLGHLVDALTAYRAQAVVWGSGLGRRVFTLAAIDTLDAWPALIVCTPATMWAWLRHLELFGRTVSLDGLDADAQLVTYTGLPDVVGTSQPQTLVVDDIGTPGVLTDTALRTLHRLDALTDMYRVAISATWPSDAESVIRLMSVLRPAEFNPAHPVTTRYPGDAQARLTAHVRAYVATRSHTTPGNDTRPFRRSSVVQVDVTDDQRDALAAACRRHGTTAPAALLVDTLEITSAGPAVSLSPKVVAAVTRAKAHLDAGHRVAVLVRHRRTATLLAGLLRVPDTAHVDAPALSGPVPHARLAVIRYDRELPDLRWFDDVVVVDAPWSWATLDAAVGSPADQGPQTVTVVHLRGSVDDRLAVLAARRKLMGPLVDHGAPPDDDELADLLSW